MALTIPECPRLIERPFPIVISGASGTGKTSVVEKLLQADGRIIRAITATTRAIRRGEEDGEDYIFLSEDQFETKKKAGYFAEFANVYDNWYGVPKEHIHQALKKGKWVVVNVDVQGGLAIQKAFPEAILIFVLPPSVEELSERLMGRGTDNPEEVIKRLQEAQEEMSYATKYDYIVVNDEIKDCTKRIMSIVLAETSRMSRGLVMPKK